MLILTRSQKRRGSASPAPLDVTGEVEVLGTPIGSTTLDGQNNLIPYGHRLDDNFFRNSSTLKEITLTGGQLGPEGFNNAVAVTETAANAVHTFNVYPYIDDTVNTGSYEGHVIVKPNLRTRLSIQCSTAAGGAYATFILSGAGSVNSPAGSAWGVGFSGWSSQIVALTGELAGWYKLTVRWTHTNTNPFKFEVYPQNTGINSTYAGDPSQPAFYIVGMSVHKQAAGADSNVLANIFDGNPDTFRHSGDYFAWAGMSAPQSVDWTGIQVVPMQGQIETDKFLNSAPTSDREHDLKAARVEVSPSDATFAVGNRSLVYTVPTRSDGLDLFDMMFKSKRNELSFSGAGRHIRLRQPWGRVSSLRFFANWSTGLTSARPMEPAISPAGGCYTGGTVPITITCRTTSAEIWYTTDGTDPTSSGTATKYAGPFTLTLGGSMKQVKAAAKDASGTLATPWSTVVTSNKYFPWGLKPIQDMYDTDGNRMEAHGARYWNGHDGYIYWCGFSFDRAMYPVSVWGTLPRTGPGYIYRCKVTDYFKKDIEFVGALANVDPIHPTTGARWFYYNRGGPAVYNANTQKWMFFTQMSMGDSPEECLLGIWESDTPGGPYTHVTDIQPHVDGAPQGMGDSFTFTNADNTIAYVVFAGGVNNANTYCSSLLGDWHSINATKMWIDTTGVQGREGTAVDVDDAGNLWHFSSTGYWWSAPGPEPGASKYAKGDNTDPILATFPVANGGLTPFPTIPTDFKRIQTSTALKLPGKREHLLLGDTWCPPSGGTGQQYDILSRYAWMKLTYNAGALTITYPDPFDMETLTDSAPTSLSPSDAQKSADIVLSDDDLTVTNIGSNPASVRSKSFLYGRHYFEVTHVSGVLIAGIANLQAPLDNSAWGGAGSAVVMGGGSYINNSPSGVPTTFPAAPVAGDVVCVDVDLLNKTIRYRLNGGTWSVPYSFAAIKGPFRALVGNTQLGECKANFGATPFAFTAPAGTTPLLS